MIILIEESENKKLGPINATYAPIKQTCSNDCKLKGTVCYAQTGYVGIYNARLQNKAQTAHASAKRLAEREAKLIGQITNGLPTRLHVSGDAKTRQAARILAKAKAKHSGIIYTYTHSWRHIIRKDWGEISVLASVETVKQANQAAKRGYTSAIIVPSFDGPKAFSMEGTDIKFIPCPAQTLDKTCQDCKLCFDDRKLMAVGRGIAFAVHGVRKNKLPVIR